MYFNLKYLLFYKHNKFNYRLYYSYYIIFNSINIIIIQYFLPKIFIIIELLFNEYVYNYNNDYTIFIEKYKYLKDYFSFKYLYCFEGYYFFKTDRYLMKMLYKFLHIDILYQLTLSFLRKAKKNKYVYEYFYK